jgi:hypothetical protein
MQLAMAQSDGEDSRKRAGAGRFASSDPPDAMPLGTVRSLAYFLPVIEEVPELRVSPDYFLYLRHKLRQIGATR